ncbi:MAG TPA: FAD-binding oxidoreductase [Hellea balneolensis]|uniref:FAD-binding oxidoreductase n=1 Tax=Hellea balneolensis TaxID=287478 RepID=A0A7C5LS89_9PROT|nr:FAD-binding oxidoreductase [Hellea balneolensis]
MTKSCLDEIKSQLPGSSWIDNPAEFEPFLHEWRGRWQGQTPLLLRPGTSEAGAQIVRICARHKTPLCVQGGNTGLVGGQIPQGEILLSLNRMRAVRSIDAQGRVMVCEAGVTLREAQMAAQEHGLKYPLSLASEGSCTIGGNLATNAGGVHVLKYGPARALCLGVEAVLADGSIYTGLSALRKDNTGYDLSQLLIGSEGTLGIITAASLKLVAEPQTISRAFIALETLDRALDVLGTLGKSHRLSMFEIMPDAGLELVCTYTHQHRPFTQNYPWYALLEWEFEDDDDPQAYMEAKLADALENGTIENAVIAHNQTKSASLLALREHMSAAQKPLGAMIKHDISVPVAKVPEFITRANRALLDYMPGIRPLPFGHMGDGNIHYNVASKPGMDSKAFMDCEGEINDLVYNIVSQLDGSISAEHGIGILKKQQLVQRSAPAKIAAMRQIKTALDPLNILNPRVLL